MGRALFFYKHNYGLPPHHRTKFNGGLLAATFRILPSLLFFLLLSTDAECRGRKAARQGIVVASYNVENYFGPEHGEGEGHFHDSQPKSERSAALVVKIIRDVNPDILGVCEMGNAVEFERFKAQLAEAGLGYTDFEYVEGPDAERHLALASRYPIISRQSRPDIGYDLDGTREKVKRGFLDVTVQIPDGTELRLVGVHLKSKFKDDPREELIRRSEANLLRRHLDGILKADPGATLLAYGDFNDTREQPAIQEVAGVRGSAGYMSELPAHDPQGDRWTHYWRPGDSYTRIDYLFANRALFAKIIPGSTRIDRSTDWNQASDHRLIFTEIASEPK